MITFFSARPELHQNYLEKRGKSISHRISLLSYRELPELKNIPAGLSIFAGIDRLSPLQRKSVTQIYAQLSAADQRLLNHPTRSWLRYQLLHKLYEMGRNTFQVFPASDFSQVERFPVFVREANQHTGSLTPLLSTHSELQQALREVVARGYSIENLLIIEYCDASDASGLIRKYSAFRVGDVILAKNLMFSKHWMVKDEHTLSDEESSEALVLEQQEYIHTNPHEAWIREIFELAEISYGRIDYGVSNSVPQVWEINTDPNILVRPARSRRPGRDRYRAERKRGQDFFHEQFRTALCKLDNAEDTPMEYQIHLDLRLRTMLRGERWRETIRRSIVTFAKNLIGSQHIQRLMPWLKPLVAKIAPRLSQFVLSKPR